jgi:hypothetical protein
LSGRAPTALCTFILSTNISRKRSTPKRNIIAPRRYSFSRYDCFFRWRGIRLIEKAPSFSLPKTMSCSHVPFGLCRNSYVGWTLFFATS